MGFSEDFVWGAATSSYQIEGMGRDFGKGMKDIVFPLTGPGCCRMVLESFMLISRHRRGPGRILRTGPENLSAETGMICENFKRIVYE